MSRPACLITAGTSRVGEALVRHFATLGWGVTFTYTHQNDAARSLAETTKSTAVHADFSDYPTAADELAAAIKGPLHLLVNNASVYETDEEIDAEVAMAVNALSPQRLAMQLAPQLAEGNGCVINMLDILAQKPMPSYSIYCSTKAALWNSTLSLARQLAPRVRVNGIAPGVVAFPPDMPEGQQTEYLKRVPLKRAGTPDDVVDLVSFLALRGTYITGQIIALDGGRSISV